MSQIHIPKRVLLTPRIAYPVRILPKHDPRLEGARGLWVFDDSTKPVTREILIEKAARVKMLCTFWHEFFHAVTEEYQIPMPHSLIYQLEKPMALVTRANKWF